MKNVFVLLIIVWLMAVPVRATEVTEELFQSLDVEQLERGFTSEENELLDGISPNTQISLWTQVTQMLAHLSFGLLGESEEHAIFSLNHGRKRKKPF